MELGYLKDEICNRDGCKGVIVEHDSDGCCSCHINPPCGYCTTSREYCPECGWDADQENKEAENERTKHYYKGFGSKQMHDEYHEWKQKNDAFMAEFEACYNGKKE